MVLCNIALFLSASAFLSGGSFVAFGFVFDVEFDSTVDNCDGKPFIDKFLDISDAEFFRLTDSKLMVNGTLKVLKAYSKDKPIIVIRTFCDFMQSHF